MKKKNAILGLALCAGLLFSAGTFSKNTSAKAGYGMSQLCNSNDYVEVFNVSVGAAGGGILGAAGGAWAGAKLGGTFGAAIGGPFGAVLGAGLGAL